MSELLIILPILTLIIMAISTQKMELSLMVSSVLALVLLHRTNIVRGTLDSLYRVLSDGSFQFCIIFLVTFGIIMKLFQESGGLQGFAELIKPLARGQRSAMVFCWIMDVVLFIDEYLDTLTVSFSMRNITDRLGVPREHLAFHVNAMSCSLCLTIPMTSWTAFTVNLIAEKDLTYTDYVRCIPMMFYPLIMIVLCLLVACGVFPKLGNLKKAYERTAAGGPTHIREKNEKSLVDIGELDESNVSSAANILLPIVVIVAGSIYFDGNMLIGLLLGMVCQFVLYMPQKLMSLDRFINNMFSGASSMLPLLMVLFMGFLLNDCNEQLGLFDLVIRLAGSAVPKALLPAATFLLVGGLVFATGTCWLIMLLTVPIFIPLAFEMGVDPRLILAALLSGVALGYSTCFYGDTIFLTAAGTEVSNMTIVRTTLPYALIVLAISVAGYVALGIMM